MSRSPGGAVGGNDYLYGGDGNDSLWGDEGNDSLNGGAGNNVILYIKKLLASAVGCNINAAIIG